MSDAVKAVGESTGLWLGVLGPLVGRHGDEEIALGGPKQQVVLAMIVAAAPSVVKADEIAQALYGDDAPERARRRVQTYVSTLRSILGDAILRAGDGWALQVDKVSVDARQFEEAIANVENLRSLDAARALSQALELWRGSPYSAVEAHGRLDAEIRRLEELQLHTLERRIDNDLDSGRAADLVPELAALVTAHPFREGLRAQHITALYRSGRQREALESFQELRSILLDELGVDPTPELQALEQRVLSQDQSLQPKPEPEGQPLRGYRLLEQIGNGAFSIVWRGIQPSVNREVAIKQIRQELTSRPEFIRRFEAEAQLIARVEHPHIVPLIDYWRDPDSAYLVMRWLRGGTIERSLDDGRWDMQRTMRMVRQVGEGLADAHSRGVIHRDVKTANILLDEQGNAFLGDFGIALEAAMTAGPEAALSHGSPAYASPEQLRREPLGPQADIFSLGVVVYECLAGHLPLFDAPTAAEMVRRQLAEPYPPLTAVRADVPVHVSEALVRATAKATADRFETVTEFVEALEATKPPASSRVRSTLLAGPTDNPYKGLRTFAESDAADFFGRDRLVDEFVGQLAGDGIAARCLSVVGPSGSGKSSVVRAGLLPALRSGRVGGAERWFITTMVPGGHPYEALEAALLRIAVNPPTTLLHQLKDGPRGILRTVRRCLPSDQDRVLVVIDQLEELFTAAAPASSDSFLQALAVAVDDPTTPLRLVTTLRADYYDRPLAHPQFASVLKAGAVDVTPLAPDELEMAITGPAERYGLHFEPGLVSRIAAETIGQPGPLPLLQHALAELFEHRDATALTTDAYDKLGGLAGSLTTRAEQLFLEGTSAEQTATRQLFGSLINPNQTRVDLRRRVLLADLGNDESTREMLDSYHSARLLTFDRDAKTREPTVEVAHESLLREWPRLATWLEEDRALLRSIEHLANSATAWHQGNRESTDLYRGGRLETATDILESSPDRLRALDREYIVQSQDAALADSEQERRRVGRLRRLVAGVSAALVLALLTGGLAFQQQRRANDEAEQAAANEVAAISNARVAEENAAEASLQRALAEERTVSASARGLAALATSLADRELDTALLLAANAAALEPSPAAEAGLYNVLNQAGQLQSSGPFPGPEGNLGAVFAAGIAAVLYEDNLLRFYDMETDEMIGTQITVGDGARPKDFALSDDGKIVAIWTNDGAEVWNVGSGEQLLKGVMPDLVDHTPILSAKGTYLILEGVVGATGMPLQVFRVSNGERLGEIALGELTGTGRISTSRDEQRLYWAVVVDVDQPGVYAAFSLPSLEPVVSPTRLEVQANIAVPSGDRSIVAVANFVPEAEITFLDNDTADPLGPTVALNAGRFNGAWWNPSSTRLAVGSTSSVFSFLSAATLSVETSVLGRASPVQGAGWLDDDRFFVVADDHKMIWNLANRSPLAEELAPSPGIDVFRDGTFVSNVGDALAVVSPSGGATRIDLGDELNDACGPVFVEPFGSVALLLCTVEGQTGDPIPSTVLIDIAAGKVIAGPAPFERDLIETIGVIDWAPSPDGSIIAIAGTPASRGGPPGGLVGLIDAETGRYVHPPTELDPWVMITVAWTPDGSLLLAAGQAADVLFIDPETWEVVDLVATRPDQAVTDISFDTSGRTAFAATESGEIWRIDLESREVIEPVLSGATSQFQSVTVSPDGGRVAATGRDGDIRVWDTETGSLLGSKFEGGQARFVRFIDNDTMVSWGHGTNLRWDIGINAVRATACRLAGRPLTDTELATYGSDLPNGDTCR